MGETNYYKKVRETVLNKTNNYYKNKKETLRKNNQK